MKCPKNPLGTVKPGFFFSYKIFCMSNILILVSKTKSLKSSKEKKELKNERKERRKEERKEKREQERKGGRDGRKKQRKEKIHKHYSSVVPLVAQQAANLTSILEVACSIPGPAQWVKDLVLP